MTDIELELDDDYLNDGPVECVDCGQIFSESALAGGGLCANCENNRDDVDDYDDVLSLRHEGDCE